MTALGEYISLGKTLLPLTDLSLKTAVCTSPSYFSFKKGQTMLNNECNVWTCVLV